MGRVHFGCSGYHGLRPIFVWCSGRLMRVRGYSGSWVSMIRSKPQSNTSRRWTLASRKRVPQSGKVPLHIQRTTVDAHVSLFETTIRHVGGLLSAYELSGKQNYTLVQKAEQVAQQLVYAFSGVRTFP